MGVSSQIFRENYSFLVCFEEKKDSYLILQSSFQVLRWAGVVHPFRRVSFASNSKIV